MGNYWKHFDTQNLTDIVNNIDEARVLSQMRVIDGVTGAGKSYSCRHYLGQTKNKDGVMLIAVRGTMSAQDFGRKLAELCKIKILGSDNLFRIETKIIEHIKTLKDKELKPVLIVDEAENLKSKSYHIIKTINDELVEQGFCGLVLVGANNYKSSIEKEAGRNRNCMPQINSRSEFLYRPLLPISTDDKEKACREMGITNKAVISHICEVCTSYRSLNHVIPTLLYKSERLKQTLTVAFCKAIFRE